MKFLPAKEKELILKLETQGLLPQQVRLIKTAITLIHHVMTTGEETEFFESSSELMKIAASIIKQSHFAEDLKEKDFPSFADQAIEYSLDNLYDNLSHSKIVTFDN